MMCICGALFLGDGLEARQGWRELWTPRFRVIFPESLRHSAQKVADLAEELLPQIETWLQVQLDFQPAIVLTDDSDIPGGSTNPLEGVIHLVVAEPYEVLANGAGFDEWLRVVLAHELVHLVHLGAVGKSLQFWRSLFGSVVLPNVIQPFWVWEGYAMYGEGMLTERQALQPFYAMILRTQALSGKLLPHYRLRGYGFPREWPGALNVYIYGVSLVDYIARNFGEAKLAELSRRRSERISLFGFEQAVRETLGISLQELWQRWQVEITEQAEEDYWRVTLAGLSPVEKLTSEGYATGGLALSPQEKTMVYSLDHPDFRSGLRIKDLESGGKKLLVRGSILGKPAFSPEGTKLVYAKLVPDRKSLYSDLYLYDMLKRQERRLTVRERAFNPVFLGETILFLRRNRFPEGVFALDLVGRTIQPVFEFDRDFHPLTIAVSGESILVSGRRRGQIEIGTIDLKARRFRPLISGLALWPVFSVHGRYLVFSMALEGVFDAFALDLETTNIFRLTRVVSGFFEPILTEEGLYGLFHTVDGFTVGLVRKEALLWEKGVVAGEPVVEGSVRSSSLRNYPERPYQPWRWLSPRFWLPLPSGFLVTAQDPVGLHWYSLRYEKESGETWGLDFSYRGTFMEPEVRFDVRREGEKWTYGVVFHQPVVVKETWKSAVSAGYERFVREDSRYPGWWEGWFGKVEASFTGGNDRILTDYGGDLIYRCGSLEALRTESMVVTLWGTWRRAGDSGLRFRVETTWGIHNLPEFFALGGWEGPWSLAGYPQETLRGRIAGKLHLEVSHPIVVFDAPFFSMGVMENLTGTLFLEGGFAGERLGKVTSLFSWGGSLTVNAWVAEAIPLALTLRYTRPLSWDCPGEWSLEAVIRFR